METTEKIEKMREAAQETAQDARQTMEMQEIVSEILKYIPLYGQQAAGVPSFDIETALLKPFESITEPPCVCRIGGRRVFSIGDISMIIGAAKSRKTLFAAALTGYILRNEQNEIITTDTEGKIVYFDTEQSNYHAQRTLNNVAAFAPDGKRKNLYFYSLRTLDRFARLVMLVKVIREVKPNFVLIDGIADLMNNTNDIEESQQITHFLMALAQIYSCHICSILHTPPTSSGTKGRGHIGSEQERKCETVILVQKTQDGEKSEVKAQATRNQSFETLTIEHATDGSPILRRTATGEKQNLVEEVAKAADGRKLTRPELQNLIISKVNEQGDILTRDQANNKIQTWLRNGTLEVKQEGSRNSKKYVFANV